MHFFTEPSQLSISNNTQYFGPKIVVSLPDPEDGGAQDYFYFRDVFRVTSIFALASPAKAFACQDAMMIVQEYIDSTTGVVNPNFVNIILKPLEGVDVPHTPVKYYIYRGVLKSSFISGTQITPDDPATKSEFITKFWKSWNDYKILMGTPSAPAALADPTPQSFGFGSLPNSQLVEEIYNSAESNNSLINDFQSIKVKEGEWIGNFGANDIGFEIVVDTENFSVNLEYLKKSNHIIDVTALLNVATPVGKFNLKVKREEVLNFIDPVAFFGMHYKVGVSTSIFSGTTKNTINNKEETLYTEILSKFYNKECFYLDIRSERGFSYNFYNNYSDAQDVNILLTRTSDSVSQESHLKYEIGSGGFPLIISRPSIEYISPVYNKKVLILKLRTDDNLEPLLFLENTQLLGASNKTNYIEKEDLLDTTTPGWTKEIRFEVPVVTVATIEQNLPYYIKIQYFRQKENPASPNTVLKNNNYLDAVFGGINISTFSVPTVFNHVRNTKRGFIKGSNFNYISETGVYFDDNRVLLYANNAYPHKESKSVYPKIDLAAFKFTPIVNSSVMLREILFNKWHVEAPASLTVDILEIVGYNQNTRRATNIENIYLLGITKTEFDSLRNNTGITNLHQRYIAFEEVINQQDIVTGTPYKKYKLKLQGLDDSGVVVSITPVTDVFVYGSSSNMLCSKDFAAAAVLPNVLPDPGTFEEFSYFHRFDYDGNDSLVTALFPGGTITVADNGNNQGIASPEVGVLGEMFYPVASAGSTVLDPSKAPYPLIVINQANGGRYTDYRWLGEHLAKNGFIAVSVSALLYEGNDEFSMTPFASFSAYFAITLPADYYVILDYSKLDTVYIYNNNSGTPYNSNYAFQKLTVLNGVWDRAIPSAPVFTITGESLLTWTKGVEFDIILNTITSIPEKIQYTLDIGYHGMAPLGRANILFAHLKVIKSYFGTNVQNNIGLLGHSRGGEAVVRAAKEIILSSSIAPVNLRAINAIISLAPTDQTDQENLIQNIPYFVLYGSMDGDVIGNPDSTTPNRNSGFSLYDRAINNTSKSMIFVHGATHNGFITNNQDYDVDLYKDFVPNLKTISTQQSIAKAYINSFFRLQLRNEAIWKSYFHGKNQPISVQTKDFYNQYKNMSTSEVETIINFESGTNIGTGVGKISLNAASANLDESSLVLKDKQTPHDTKGLLVKWSSGDILKIKFATAGKNISSYEYISFRIGQQAKVGVAITEVQPAVLDSSGNYQYSPKPGYKYNAVKGSAYSSLDDLKIKLQDITNATFEVKIPRKIPEPAHREGRATSFISVDDSGTPSDKTDDKVTYGHQNLTKSAMMTLRIQLADFASNGVDLTKINEISIIFPSGSGDVIIDDIEFTQ